MIMTIVCDNRVFSIADCNIRTFRNKKAFYYFVKSVADWVTEDMSNDMYNNAVGSTEDVSEDKTEEAEEVSGEKD